MNFGSLFSGIGGIDLGLERAGMSCAWQVEIDPFCRRVLEKHWPRVPRFQDVREVGKHNLLPVDLIAGGFPCQDISATGLKAGIQGERSGLWKEFARLIGELRPPFVFVENVAALLTRGFGTVLGDLATLGYDAEWDCIPASAFGAPHQRDRLWLVAYSTGLGMGEGWVTSRRDEAKFPVFEGSRGTFPQSAFWRESWLEVSARLCRMGDGIPNRIHRGRSLGNAVVPEVVEWIGRRIINRTEHQ